MASSNIQSFEFRASMTEIVREAQKLTGKLEQLDSTFAKVGRSAERSQTQLFKFAATYVSLRTGFQLAGSGLNILTESIEKANQRTVEFTDEMKGLISLDQNARSIDQLNNKVLQLSTSFGLSTKQVADANFAIQSSASTLADSIQEDILKSALTMSKISPVAPVDTAFALTKGMITFGKEVSGVTDLMNRMKLSADLGGQSFEDMAHYFPAAATAGHALGLGLNELLASYSLLTQVGAKVSRTGTQMRDMFNTMLDPLRSGIDFSRGWTGAMEQLAAQGTQVWSRVYGTESIEAIINLTSRTEDYFTLLEQINAAGRDQVDIAQEIYDLRLKNQQIATAEAVHTATAIKKQADLDYASGRWALEEASVYQQSKPWMRWASFPMTLLGRAGQTVSAPFDWLAQQTGAGPGPYSTPMVEGAAGRWPGYAREGAYSKVQSEQQFMTKGEIEMAVQKSTAALTDEFKRSMREVVETFKKSLTGWGFQMPRFNQATAE